MINVEDLDGTNAKKYEGISLFAKVQRSRKSYHSLLKNDILSRAMRGY